MVDFTIGLKIHNEAHLDALFWQVSDPKSPQYRQYLDIQSLGSLFGPSSATISDLTNWLQTSLNPLRISVPPSRNVIQIRGAPAKLVQKLFGIPLFLLESTEGNRLVRCVDTLASCDIHVPTQYAAVIESLEGLADFPPLALLQSSHKRPALATDINITPKEIFLQYGIPKEPSTNCNRSAQCVAEFSGGNWLQSYSPTDLASFQKLYGLLVQPSAKLYGKNTPTQPTGEATLDIQYIMAAGQGVPTWFWGETGSYLDYLVHIENEPNGPLVHSISYSIGDEMYMDASHMNTLNNHFKLIALRGISLIWASGDEGTGNTGMFGCGLFSPGFPATSPYITSVGATSLTKLSSEADSLEATPYGEHAAQYSGGGFSTLFSRPKYQDTFVKNYFTNEKANLPPASYFNASGRGFPDVSAVGTNFLVLVGGIGGPPMPVSGTSAATPVFSAMLAMINNELIAAGKPPIGFANPALYGAPQDIWHPITEGNNACYPCNAGFTAASPWAPISGLGAPDFEALKAYFLSL